MLFVQIFLIGVLAGISPGPDFFIVMQNSLEHGKKIGIASACGVASALLIHASYTILGLALLLQEYVSVFKLIQIVGACYLAYLGLQAVLATLSNKKMEMDAAKGARGQKTFGQGFKNGFLCNMLNPKAFLFFLSVFSQFMTPETPRWVEWVYGLEVVVAVGGWFVFLSIAISSRFFRRGYQKCRKWLDRSFGGILLYFAYKISRSALN